MICNIEGMHSKRVWSSGECNSQRDTSYVLTVAQTQRYEAPLENVRKGDDQQAMCATTPATVRHVVYDSPSVCQMRVCPCPSTPR